MSKNEFFWIGSGAQVENLDLEENFGASVDVGRIFQWYDSDPGIPPTIDLEEGETLYDMLFITENGQNFNLTIFLYARLSNYFQKSYYAKILSLYLNFGFSYSLCREIKHILSKSPTRLKKGGFINPPFFFRFPT